MKFVFLSNFLNHHQMPFCLQMYEKLGNDFWFVATRKIPKERLSFGYEDMNRKYPFVIRTYEGAEQWEKAQQLTDEANVVMHGSAPMEFLQRRLREKKLTFLYSERLYKTGYEAWKLPVRLWRFWKNYGRHKNLYMLCASAYTAGDFAKTLTFLNKTYKWGYFPEVKRYENVDTLLSSKKPAAILWAGRFLNWKHPEYVIEVARRLKAEGYDFHIQMLGSGKQWDATARQIRQYDLQEQVQLVGAVPAEEVRAYMDAASIFLFTSDRNEGWGAVLNESMNSGCAVVACSAIGSVPFLLQDGKNGFIYPSGDVDTLYEKVKYLLDNPEICREMGRHAYETMTKQWNAENAASRLLALSEALLAGNPGSDLYEDGPCSKAEILRDGWFVAGEER